MDVATERKNSEGCEKGDIRAGNTDCLPGS